MDGGVAANGMQATTESGGETSSDEENADQQAVTDSDMDTCLQHMMEAGARALSGGRRHRQAAMLNGSGRAEVMQQHQLRIVCHAYCLPMYVLIS